MMYFDEFFLKTNQVCLLQVLSRSRTPLVLYSPYKGNYTNTKRGKIGSAQPRNLKYYLAEDNVPSLAMISGESGKSIKLSRRISLTTQFVGSNLGPERSI